MQTLTIAVVLVLVGALLLWQLLRTQKKIEPKKVAVVSAPKLTTPQRITPWEPAWSEHTWELYKELLDILQGDVDKARNLMKLLRVKHPGKQLDWYFDTLIIQNRSLDRVFRSGVQSPTPPSPPVAIPDSFRPPNPPSVELQQSLIEKEKELLLLLQGNRQAAERLLAQAKANNPGESRDWYFDKVIYDLTRDRL